MFGKLGSMFGIGEGASTGGTGGPSQPDMQITAEGTQPLSDFGWKKRENKYLGANSISDKENKEQKELLKKSQLE